MIKDIQAEILKLKKENDVAILAHTYIDESIREVADYVGDSFYLAEVSTKISQKTVILCGVHFMAETCKMLSPEKKVILSSPDAGCPMAEMISVGELKRLKEDNPDYAVVSYINTTAALKELSDVCVTSSSALKICEKLPNDNILFIPDRNLGSYVKAKLPQKNVKLVNGCCPIHAQITEDEVLMAKIKYPNALFLVHPECKADVVKHADYVGSTSGIIDYALKSDAKEFIIGTENAVAESLQFLKPDKNFYKLSKKFICPNMKSTSLVDVLKCLNGEGGLEILMSEEQIKNAKKPIDVMLELGQ